MKRNIIAQAVGLMAAMTTVATAQEETQPPLKLTGVETQGAHVVDVATGEVIYDYLSGHRLTPASTTKLFTTAMALLELGPDHRIRTDIGVDRQTAEVIVHGRFDPTTDSQYFNRNQLIQEADTIAAKLKTLGMQRIKLTGDVSLGLFSPYCSKRLWEDMGNYYGAAPTCLTADDNMVTVYFHSPEEDNAACDIDSVVPTVGELKPVSYVRTYAGNADRCNIYMAGEDLWYATGCIPKGKGSFAVKATMPSAEKHYIDKLADMLRARGVDVTATAIETERRERRDSIIGAIYSPRIAEIAAAVNQRSVNLFADGLMMTMSAKWSHATWSGATEKVKEYWNKRLGFKLTIYDGSGLSPMGAISPSEMTSLLTYMWRSKASKTFRETLATMGRTGTLRNMGAGSRLAGRVWAKSGSMAGVLAYSGYAKDKNGRMLAFSIIVNHHQESTANMRNEVVRWLEKIVE